MGVEVRKRTGAYVLGKKRKKKNNKKKQCLGNGQLTWVSQVNVLVVGQPVVGEWLQ